MRDMHWYVYTGNFNGQRIEKYDIFQHASFEKGVKEAYKRFKNDFDAFAEEVKRDLMYYFWSKCEWEIILSGWPATDRFKEEKIDVYDQVMLNWDVFIKYIWEQAHARKLPEKKARKKENMEDKKQ